MAWWIALGGIVVLSLAGWGQSAAPVKGPAEAALLDRVSKYAREYGDQMPDFVCVRVTRRSEDNSGTGKKWKLLDTIEEGLACVEGREDYIVLKVNGKAVKGSARLASGFNSQGEFGEILAGIFAEDTQAAFQWGAGDSSNGGRAEVLHFRVDRAHSGYRIQEGGSAGIKVGFGGLIYADPESGAVERLRVETDPPTGLNVSNITTDVRFARAAIGGKTYMLPAQAEATIQHEKTILKREMEFRDYHKYSADSTVFYGPVK